MRSGYYQRAFELVKSSWPAPSSRYCFCNSSSRLARMRRIMPAVPAVPMTITGIQEMVQDGHEFRPAHRLADEGRVHQPP